ncbi:hypothetical protein MIZ03_3439 [Rhodoferax lithotrophicus]|uniref:DUF3857 domain-containing protein n=2 Tax=Rhodoferax lithotrophicus TaxID=2798804 RepID=A0ABN6D9W4_9BURK|nr:hypothetical protein MIZ03_3439 [Rhodoferax sp. MIZ03]
MLKIMHWVRSGILAVGVCLCGCVVYAAAPLEYKIEKPPIWVTSVVPDLAAALPAEKQNGGVSYLLVDRQVLVKGDSKLSYHHMVFKIQNESGLENSSNIEIRFDPSYQTLLLHTVSIRRGDQLIPKLLPAAIKVLQRETSLEQLVFNGSKTANLFLDDVRVGDVVEYAYTLRGSNPVFGGRHYSQFDFQWGTPVQHVYARLLAEPDRKIAFKLVNTQQAAEVHTVAGMQEYAWDLKDVSALRSRDDAPAWYDPYPSVQWSDFSDWGAVVQWGIPLYKTPSRLSSELAAEVDRIKLQFASSEDRVVEALRYVQKTVRYLGVEVGPGSHAPTPPDVVLSRRFGDCKDKTLLTLTLLKALEVDASAALVNSRAKKGIFGWQASPGAFDHVIVRVKLGGESYWLDPTLQPQMGRLGDISQANFGYSLVLEPGQTELSEMRLGQAMMYTRKVLTVLDSRGGWLKPVSLTVTTLLEGVSAERMRATLAKESPEDLQKKLVNYFARYYPGIAVVRPYEMSDNKANNQITLTEYYEVSDLWKSTKDDRMEAYAAIPDVNDFLRAPQNTVRSEPMGLFHPVDVRQTTYVLLPEKWKFKGGTSKVNDPVFDFESSASFVPGRLTMVDTYRSKSDAIEAKNMSSYLANTRKARDMLGYTFSQSTKSLD